MLQDRPQASEQELLCLCWEAADITSRRLRWLAVVHGSHSNLISNGTASRNKTTFQFSLYEYGRGRYEWFIITHRRTILLSSRVQALRANILCEIHSACLTLHETLVQVSCITNQRTDNNATDLVYTIKCIV